MTPRVRKLSLLTHVVCSVGWIGAVLGFLVVSIAALTSLEVETVRGAYLSMDLLGRYALLPLSLAAVVTGLVQALGTEWGLIRFYWVLVKFVLTILATVALVLHQFTAVAQVARITSTTPTGILPDVGTLGIQLVADSALALVLLIVIAAISIFKPWGRTPFGLRELRLMRAPAGSAVAATADDASGISLGLKLFIGVLVALALAFVISHLAGGGFGHHGH